MTVSAEAVPLQLATSGVILCNGSGYFTVLYQNTNINHSQDISAVLGSSAATQLDIIILHSKSRVIT